MFNLVDLSSLRRLCLFVPDIQAAKLLETALIAEGLAIVSVASFEEFRTAIRRGHYTAIITTSSCIDGIRETSDLPIIDIQSLLEDWRRTGGRKPSAFEGMSFLRGSCFIAVKR